MKEWASAVSTKQGATYSWTIPQKKTTRLTGGIGEKSKCSCRSARLAYICDFKYDSSLSLSFLSLSFSFSPGLVRLLVSQLRHLASPVSNWLLGLLSFSPTLLFPYFFWFSLFPSMSPAPAVSLCSNLMKADRDMEKENLGTSDGAVSLCSFVFSCKRCIFFCLKVQSCDSESQPKYSFKKQKGEHSFNPIIWDLLEYLFYMTPKEEIKTFTESCADCRLLSSLHCAMVLLDPPVEHYSNKLLKVVSIWEVGQTDSCLLFVSVLREAFIQASNLKCDLFYIRAWSIGDLHKTQQYVWMWVVLKVTELQKHQNHNTVPHATKITKSDAGFLRSSHLKRAE